MTGSGAHEARTALLNKRIVDVVHVVEGPAKTESLYICLEDRSAVEIKPGLLAPDHPWLVLEHHPRFQDELDAITIEVVP